MMTEPVNGADDDGADADPLVGAVVGAVDGAVVVPELEQAPMTKAAASARAPSRLGLVIVTSIWSSSWRISSPA